MTENECASLILNICFKIHKELGPGLFEHVYEEILLYELTSMGLHAIQQKGIPVIWKEKKMKVGFKADIIVEGLVIVEIISIECIAPVHKKQLLTYLKLSQLKLGLLINFNEALLKNGITRIVNNL